MDGERSGRPDLVLRLPTGGCVPVDSKATWEAYQDSLNAEEPGTREELLAGMPATSGHACKRRQKAYWSQFPHAPEMVVLFIPSEAAFAAAAARDPELLAYAIRQRCGYHHAQHAVCSFAGGSRRLASGRAVRERRADSGAWGRARQAPGGRDKTACQRPPRVLTLRFVPTTRSWGAASTASCSIPRGAWVISALPVDQTWRRLNQQSSVCECRDSQALSIRSRHESQFVGADRHGPAS